MNKFVFRQKFTAYLELGMNPDGSVSYSDPIHFLGKYQRQTFYSINNLIVQTGLNWTIWTPARLYNAPYSPFEVFPTIGTTYARGWRTEAYTALPSDVRLGVSTLINEVPDLKGNINIYEVSG